MRMLGAHGLGCHLDPQPYGYSPIEKDWVTSATVKESALTSSAAAAGVLSVWVVL